jgi:hypothetical protein
MSSTTCAAVNIHLDEIITPLPAHPQSGELSEIHDPQMKTVDEKEGYCEPELYG